MKIFVKTLCLRFQLDWFVDNMGKDMMDTPWADTEKMRVFIKQNIICSLLLSKQKKICVLPLTISKFKFNLALKIRGYFFNILHSHKAIHFSIYKNEMGT